MHVQFDLPPTPEPHTCFYSPAAERHRTLTGTLFRADEDRRLGWSDWLVTNRAGLPARRWSPISVKAKFHYASWFGACSELV